MTDKTIGLQRFSLTGRVEELKADLQQQAIAQIKTAARILEKDPQRLDSVTWRLVDALLDLGATDDELPGVHYPTYLGAQVTYQGRRTE